MSNGKAFGFVINYTRGQYQDVFHGGALSARDPATEQLHEKMTGCNVYGFNIKLLFVEPNESRAKNNQSIKYL